MKKESVTRWAGDFQKGDREATTDKSAKSVRLLRPVLKYSYPVQRNVFESMAQFSVEPEASRVPCHKRTTFRSL